MRKIKVVERTVVTIEGVEGLFEKVVTRFGSGAKIDCPKQYLGRAVFVIIRKPGAPLGETVTRRSVPRQD